MSVMQRLDTSKPISVLEAEMELARQRQLYRAGAVQLVEARNTVLRRALEAIASGDLSKAKAVQLAKVALKKAWKYRP